MSYQATKHGFKNLLQTRYPRHVMCKNRRNRAPFWASPFLQYNAPFSSYEYPTRTETPQVSQTLASDRTSTELDPSSSTAIKFKSKAKSSNHIDRFDDGETLSTSKRNEILTSQKKTIITELHPKHKITPTIPESIPPNYPTTQLSIPSVELTTLPSSSLRIASQETYGQVATIGILCDFGSRYESFPKYTGVNHLMELLAFQSTHSYPSAAHIVEKMDTLGGSTFASSSREQMLYCVDILRPSVDQAMELLSETVLRPNLLDHEIEEMKQVMLFQHEEWNSQGGIGSEVALGEGIQLAAYQSLSKNETEQPQQLGKLHFCPPENLLNLSAQIVNEFRSEHLVPHRMVVAGAGIEHSHLLDLVDKYINPYLPSSSSSSSSASPRIDSIYTGGEHRHILPSSSLDSQTPIFSHNVSTDSLTRVALAFELPKGWSSPDLVPACVLQTLLGGGNSFSAGGPGKGMYSRLYRDILNRFYWAESAEAFTSFHYETGLMGMSGSTFHKERGRDLVRVLAEQFAKLASVDVTDEELNRAKNMLRCNVLTQLESRLVLFEDIGRQILTYGKREDVTSMCDKIDAVTKQDIRRVAETMISKPPTLCIVGGEEEVDMIYRWDEVKSWFQH